ncbi:RnfABCDGE type electron transport complex subunit D [Lentisphaerota bacterium WC36G]|nr:RnfABCDGE type electron transport complex subunit D [Lentisphaerae bacterium WC36]
MNVENIEKEPLVPKENQLMISSSPHVHNGNSVPRIMGLVILALAPAIGAGVYFWGMSALTVLLYCVIFCVAMEASCLSWRFAKTLLAPFVIYGTLCVLTKAIFFIGRFINMGYVSATSKEPIAFIDSLSEMSQNLFTKLFSIPEVVVIIFSLVMIALALTLEIIKDKKDRLANKECSGALIAIKDGSAILTGLLLAMNLAAGTPWWICLVGAFLAIVIGKQVFGGIGNNPFNPALVARVGLFIGFASYLSTWRPTTLMLKTSDSIYNKLFFNNDTVYNSAKTVMDFTTATPLAVAKELADKGADFSPLTTKTAYLNYFLGNMGGCIGETSALALLIGAVILIWFKLIKWEVPVYFVGTVAVVVTLANLFGNKPVTPNALFHILTGGLLLGAIFMATDMVTSPSTKLGCIVFAIGCGLLTSVIRIWGGYPEGVSFSILIMNALVPMINNFTAKKPFGYVNVKAEA